MVATTEKMGIQPNEGSLKMSDNIYADKIWVLQNEAGRFWFEKKYPEFLDGEDKQYIRADKSILISELEKVVEKWDRIISIVPELDYGSLFTPSPSYPDTSYIIGRVESYKVAIKDLKYLIDKGRNKNE